MTSAPTESPLSGSQPGPTPSATTAAPIPVVVAGALGRMGAEVIKAVLAAADTTLVAAIDTTPGKEGMDVGLELRREDLEVEHHTFLDQAWGTSVRPCVMPVNWAMKPPHQTPIVLNPRA